jgi:glycosyltransferase involved in cell wall biosynthesis
MKTVTVIIPTFNRWPVICDAVDSVLNQSYPQTKCMVVDDASTDETVALLMEKYGSRVSVIPSRPNRGQSFCKNLGAESCDGDWIGFLDSDDLLEPDAVERRISLCGETLDTPTVLFGLFRTHGMKRHPLLDRKRRGDALGLTEYLEQNAWCNNNGFLVDRSVFLADGMYGVRLRNGEDIELLLRLLSKHPFYYCGTEIGIVRDGAGHRARNQYERIVARGTLLSDIVLGHPQIKDQLGQTAAHRLRCSDVEETLRALYKLGRYGAYRAAYKKARDGDMIQNTRKFFRRFLLSYVKEWSDAVLRLPPQRGS